MQQMTTEEVNQVNGGRALYTSGIDVPGSCQAGAFASEAFGQALALGGFGLFTGGLAGAGAGFTAGIITGNLYQGGKCIYDLIN
jgi:hypothetical protein